MINPKYTSHSFPYSRTAEWPEISGGCSFFGFNITEKNVFISLDSKRKISKREAYEKLSQFLSLLALYPKVGFIRRPDSGIGGYFAGNHRQNISINDCTNNDLNNVVIDLQGSSSPFQIQSRFVLSRAYAQMSINDSESAAIEFFKIIELYIKQLALDDCLAKETAESVLGSNGRMPQLFNEEVYDVLVKEFSEGVKELVVRYKKLRNAYLGHGGMRPEISELFGDPESNQKRLQGENYTYEGFNITGGPFYERVMYDMEPLAVLFFSKLNKIRPFFNSIPICHYQPDRRLMELLEKAGLNILAYDYPDKFFAKCEHIKL